MVAGRKLTKYITILYRYLNYTVNDQIIKSEKIKHNEQDTGVE